MEVYKCKCKWTFVVGKKNVYGPIFDDGMADSARLMSIKEWADGYSDCSYRYLLRKH